MNTDTSPRQPKRKILLVEDESLLRGMLCQALEDAGFDVDPHASAASASKAFADFDPDALICDIDLGGGASGLDLIVSLTKEAPYLAVVVVSNYEITPDYRQKWFGNISYLRKNELSGPHEIIDALEDAFQDKPANIDTNSTDRLGNLTRTQLQVLRLVAEGLSNSEIAERRGGSIRSVEHVIQRIFIALGLVNDPSINLRVAAARIYIESAGRPAQ